MSSNKKTVKPFTENKFVQLLWFLSFMIIFITFSITMRVYMQVEDIEEKLSYKAPVETNVVTQTDTVKATNNVYVPVYSHVYSKGGKPVLLESTLSFRNTSAENSIILNSVNYYASNGQKIKEYLSSMVQIAPLATVEFLVEEMNIEGGSGANFIVKWSAEGAVSEPVIEAVMVSADSNQSFAFKSRGVNISK